MDSSTLEHPHKSHPGEPTRATLQRLRSIGHICLVSTLIVFILTGIFWGPPYPDVWKLVLAHFAGGRAANATIGLNYGFNTWFILFQACMQDFIVMFYAYPFFVTGFQFASRWPFLGPALQNTHDLAFRHKDRIAPYGVAGLLAFVIFPLWSTGPLVGVVVGYLLGMSARLCFMTVMIGNTIAMALWIWAFEFINGKLAAMHEHLPLIVAGIIVGVAVIGGIWHGWRRIRKKIAARILTVPDDETEDTSKKNPPTPKTNVPQPE